MASKKRGPGRPRKPVLSKRTDEVMLVMLSCGATFDHCAEELGVSRISIFSRMYKDPALQETVYRARAKGITIRGMLLEDKIAQAIELVANDPRYTTLVIFAAKAMLKWTDLPDNLTSGTDFGEVIKEITAGARDRKRNLRQSPAQEYLTVN